MATDTSMSQRERYDSTDVPLSQVFTPDNRSVADVQGDANADMRTGSTAAGASYGPNTYHADNSVAPVSVTLAPNVTKGSSTQRASPSASQSGALSWQVLLACGIPIAAFLLVRYLMTREDSAPSTTIYVDTPWW